MYLFLIALGKLISLCSWDRFFKLSLEKSSNVWSLSKEIFLERYLSKCVNSFSMISSWLESGQVSLEITISGH
jgi:hypothetical protein